MTPDTDTDLTALEAEIEALAAEGAAIDARTDALLAGWQPMPTSTQRMATFAAALEAHSRELDAIQDQQAEIATTLDALGL